MIQFSKSRAKYACTKCKCLCGFTSFYYPACASRGLCSLAQPDPLPNATLRKRSGDTAQNDLYKWNLVGVSKSQMNSADAL